MTFSKINKITRHEITLLPPTPSEPDAFGWIRLLDGDVDAGYVYLTTPPVIPRMNSAGTYIVTSMPMAQLQVLLSILRNESDLQIRYFDPQSAGVGPTVFIETAWTDGPRSSAGTNGPDEIAEEMIHRRLLHTIHK